MMLTYAPFSPCTSPVVTPSIRMAGAEREDVGAMSVGVTMRACTASTAAKTAV